MIYSPNIDSLIHRIVTSIFLRVTTFKISKETFVTYIASIYLQEIKLNYLNLQRVHIQQGRKRPFDTPKRMIERREREGKREKER